MAMFYAAYFDASGKHEGYRVLTIAGAVSPLKKWSRFEKQWNKVLLDEGVTEFHATDFAAGQGEYRDWKGDKVRRKEFLERLVAIIRANVNKLFSVSVELAAWDKINSEYCFAEHFYSPYSLAGFAVIDQTLRWAKNKKLKPPEFIFEDGDDGWSGLLELCKWDPITPIRLPKAKAVPCQVGDMLAWKSRITATNTLGKLREMERTGNYDEETILTIQSDLQSLSKLQQVCPGSTNLFAPETLLSMCRKNNIRRRTAIVL